MSGVSENHDSVWEAPDRPPQQATVGPPAAPGTPQRIVAPAPVGPPAPGPPWVGAPGAGPPAVPQRIVLPPHMRPVPPPMPGVPAGNPPPRAPSGLFPSGPPRPTYREPGPVRGGAVAAGAGSAALWMLLFGLLGRDARGYAWWTIGAGLAAWLAALILARFGDRGVAVGAAVATGVGVAIVGVVIFAKALGGHWLLW